MGVLKRCVADSNAPSGRGQRPERRKEFDLVNDGLGSNPFYGMLSPAAIVLATHSGKRDPACSRGFTIGPALRETFQFSRENSCDGQAIRCWTWGSARFLR